MRKKKKTREDLYYEARILLRQAMAVMKKNGLSLAYEKRMIVDDITADVCDEFDLEDIYVEC